MPVFLDFQLSCGVIIALLRSSENQNPYPFYPFDALTEIGAIAIENAKDA
jgi:hypothetical protein